MKKFLALFALLSVALACNLMGKKDSNTNSSSSSSGTSTTADGEPVEKANPTAAQQAAIANGQTVTWDQQGITWTLPANWKKHDVRNEMFSAGGGGAFLGGNISTMDESFPVDISLKAMYDGAKTNLKNGKYDRVRWVEIDGLRGVEFRESNPERPDDIRRLQWQAYRKYAGQVQLVNLILSTNGANFAEREDQLFGILYSTKVVH